MSLKVLEFAISVFTPFLILLPLLKRKKAGKSLLYSEDKVERTAGPSITIAKKLIIFLCLCIVLFDFRSYFQEYSMLLIAILYGAYYFSMGRDDE